MGIWLIVELGQEGEFVVFNRRWLNYREIQILEN